LLHTEWPVVGCELDVEHEAWVPLKGPGKWLVLLAAEFLKREKRKSPNVQDKEKLGAVIRITFVI
jgi:hypothetical protein